MRTRVVTVLAAWLLASAVLATAGCGGDEGERRELTVSAAASLTEAFDEYAPTLAPTEVELSFAGSDELAAQIRQGAEPDVYAAASAALPQALFEEGLVEEPVVFTSNALVLAVPPGSDIDAVEDLTAPGIDLLIGAQAVPVGSYTREVLDQLPAPERDAVLANVRSEESDVKGIVGKLTQGAADAGFVYSSDVVATRGALEAVELPRSLEPDVAYAVAVVSGTDNPAGAREFIDGLLEGEGAGILRDAGFQPPPER